MQQEITHIDKGSIHANNQSIGAQTAYQGDD